MIQTEKRCLEERDLVPLSTQVRSRYFRAFTLSDSVFFTQRITEYYFLTYSFSSCQKDFGLINPDLIGRRKQVFWQTCKNCLHLVVTILLDDVREAYFHFLSSDRNIDFCKSYL